MSNSTTVRNASTDGAALTGTRLRAMSRAELARLGEDSLREHLVETAILAHQQYAPVAGPALGRLLEDRHFVRHPVRLAFELGSMAPHQFAQPEPETGGYVLYVHPGIEQNSGDVACAVAYFLPLINYGGFINDEHCLIYGATLLGSTARQYYKKLCHLADSLGAASHPAGAS